jgi:hypothetical protein
MILQLPKITIVVLAVLSCVALLAAGCTPISGKAEARMISKLEPKFEALFPLMNTQITCTAADPDGGALTYKWTSTEGTIEGSGPQITWIAPNQIGWFPVMVTVQNSKGQTDQQTIKLAVVEKNATTCPTCPATGK